MMSAYQELDPIPAHPLLHKYPSRDSQNHRTLSPTHGPSALAPSPSQHTLLSNKYFGPCVFSPICNRVVFAARNAFSLATSTVSVASRIAHSFFQPFIRPTCNRIQKTFIGCSDLTTLWQSEKALGREKKKYTYNPLL